MRRLYSSTTRAATAAAGSTAIKIPSFLFSNCELQGFYNLGVATYMNTHYDISKYVMLGSGAGAWNAVLATYKGDKTRYVSRVENIVKRLNNEFHSYTRPPKPMWLLQKGKTYIMQEFRYDYDEFDLSRVAIGVYHFDTEILLFRDKIITQFHDFQEGGGTGGSAAAGPQTAGGNLENALNCCIASCYIPFLTEYSLYYSHQGQFLFEGGFIENYFISDNLKYNNVIEINPNMWKTGHPMPYSTIYGFHTTWPHRKEYDFVKTFHAGYNDTAKNQSKLNKFLRPL